MPSPSFLKCSCNHCGGHIEFPRDGVGQSIPCPHCGQTTPLNQIVDLVEPIAPKQKKPFFLIAVVLGALFCAMALGILLAINKNAEPKPLAVVPVKMDQNDSSPSPVPVKRRKNATKVSKESPRAVAVVPGVDWNGLKASAVTVENSGGRLIYAVGTIRNETERQRFGVTMSLDLFDAQGKKIGFATDYTQLIEPKKEWNFKALITDPKAVRAEITGVKEN